MEVRLCTLCDLKIAELAKGTKIHPSAAIVHVACLKKLTDAKPAPSAFDDLFKNFGGKRG